MKIRLDQDNLSLLLPLTAFAVGTLYIGSNYGPVSAFIPFWASIFMLVTCLFVLLGMDKAVDDEEDHEAAKGGLDNHNVLASALWITVYVVMAYVVGMIPAAVAYTFFSMYFFGGKKLLMAAGTSAVLGLILFGLFEFILEKELYKGVFIEGYF